ncbi:hypothetical protein D3C84_1178380 [compost metagenome]
MRCVMQAETGALAEHLVGADVAVGAGEFHAITEGLAQPFCALEGQHIEACIEPANTE